MIIVSIDWNKSRECALTLVHFGRLKKNDRCVIARNRKRMI